MPVDSSLIGATSSPETFEVTREAVERFMAATEDPALQGDKPVEYAPPTFPTTFRVRVPGLELDGSKMQLIHGEQRYSYTRQLRIGETDYLPGACGRHSRARGQKRLDDLRRAGDDGGG